MADPIEQFLSRLHHPSLAAIDLKLDRMLRLLSMLGNPHKRLPPVIHVAGTNGKGSLIAYLKAIFESAGLRVHVYTSPHLVQFRERIVLNGKMIENSQIENIVKHVAPILSQQPATFFEATTALAMIAFAGSKADVLLLETGVGGRLDATNVIDQPILTAITPISFDHTEYLGDTLSKIASEKAGILKKNVPCVIGRQEPESLAVLEEKAGELHAPLFRLGQEWNVRNGQYISPTKTLALKPSLAGSHQLDNAGAAVACIERLPQFAISDQHITEGLATAYWPARLQRLTQGPYVQLLPHHELWLDGGHNLQGAEIFSRWAKEQGRPIYAICGMIQGKDSDGFMQAIKENVSALYAITIPNETTSKKAEEVAASAVKAGIPAQTASSIEHALQQIAKDAPQNPNNSALVAIIGSLYLAGFVLQTHR